MHQPKSRRGVSHLVGEWSSRRRFRARGWLGVLGVLGLGGCATGQGECQANAWSGTCALVDIAKVRQSEFPLPNITLQALYRPQPVAGVPNLLPPDVRREFGALERHEEALRGHLQRYPLLRCYVVPPAPGKCTTGELTVEVPEFDAASAVASQPDAGPRGCAQIEAASSQDKLASNQTGRAVLTERFSFAENSAEVSAADAASLDSLAAKLKGAPNLQCVGVVGAWVRGESLSVAFGRARAVREQLLQRGVEAERLIALTLDPPMVGASGTPEPPNPSDRRVTVSVLLDLPPAL